MCDIIMLLNGKKEKKRKELTTYPTSACLTLTQYTGPNSTIQAISISSHVHIGNNCTIGPFVIIKENVKILPHTVVPANMVIASGSVIGGRPARVVGDVGEGWGVSGGGGGGLGVGGGSEDKWVEGGDLRELVRSIR
jgi:dynactin-5